MEILDAIAQVHRHDATQTVGWLEAVAPVIDQITEFTDGDETHHTRSELIRTVGATLPELLPAFHRHHIEQEDWNYADDALHEFVKHFSLEGPCASALASTLLDPGSLGILDKRSLEDPLVGAVLGQQIDFLGGQTPRAGKLPKDSEEREAKKKCVSVRRYSPKRLAALLSRLSGPETSYEEKRTGFRRWLEHWETEGRAVEALAAMEAQLDKLTSGVFLDESFDVAFRISLANEGKEAAFRWLARAHSSRYGWASYMVSEEETMSRLRIRPMSLSSPIDADVAEHGEFTITAHLVADDYSGDELHDNKMEIADFESAFNIEGDRPETPLEKYSDQGEGSAAPVCTSMLPQPYGYWQSHYFATGLPVAASYVLPMRTRMRCTWGGVELLHADHLVGTTSYWHDRWSPEYPREGNTRCGVYSTLDATLLPDVLKRLGRSLVWKANMRLWQRASTLDEFEIFEKTVVFGD